MSNFLTSEDIATITAKIVGKDLNLAALLHRDVEADFRPGGGNLVKIRVPGAVEAQTRSIYSTTQLVTGDIAEQAITVELTDEIYNSVLLTDGQLDLDIKDFATQVLAPQAASIRKEVERRVAAALSSTPADTSIEYSPEIPAKAFTQLRRKLRDNGVSAETPLFAVVGSGVYADLLDAGAGTFDADGKVRGFHVVESTRLASDEIVAFIRNAFTLVVRAPIVPDGAPYGASVVADDFAIRHTRSYDGSIEADRSTVSTFVAVEPMPLPVDNEDGTVSLVDNGGAVRIAPSDGSTEPEENEGSEAPEND